MDNDNVNEATKLHNVNYSQKIPKYIVDRNVLKAETVIQESGYEPCDKSIGYTLKNYWNSISFIVLLKNIIPILQWAPNYSIKEFLIGDIFAGITVAVMHIPQGMAYGILAGVSPSVGLYMAFFPVIMYCFLGTSRHISIGTFAVISLMTLKVVQTHTVDNDGIQLYTPMDVVTATAIVVGIIHVCMAVLSLGFLATLLSEPLVNAFTTGAAVHVVCSQLRDLLGISIIRYKGPFKIIYTLADVFRSFSKTNIATLIFSLGVIIFMVIVNEIIKPKLSKICRFPLPVELITVIGSNLISRFVEVNSRYFVELVGNIPTGLPMPKLPPIDLLPKVALDSIAIAIVSYSVVMSMALIFARKHSYEISANQELFAMGISNIFGGIFSCIPLACSLSRSLIQELTGGNTQIASIVSALLILIILLWIGPFFETLPRCVLAGIVIVALKGMYTQVRHVGKFSKQGKCELLTWIITFVCVIFIDIDYGLFIGIVVSIFTLYHKGWKPYGTLLGEVSNSDLYVDLNNHKNASEVPNIKIFRYAGSVNFATRSSFKKTLYKTILIDKTLSIEKNDEIDPNNKIKSLIIDLSAINHMDVSGCSIFSEIIKNMLSLGIRTFFVNPTDNVYDTITHSMAFGEGPFEVFYSIHDAVLFAKTNQLS